MSSQHTSDYPLELLASTAAHLLTSDNYPDAVERALCLLDECAARLTGIKLEKARINAAIERHNSEYADTIIPYSEALMRITQTENRGRAKERYIEWVKSEHPEWSPERVQESLDEFRGGHDLAYVDSLKYSYAAWWKESGKRKRPQKSPGKTQKTLDRAKTKERDTKPTSLSRQSRRGTGHVLRSNEPIS